MISKGVLIGLESLVLQAALIHLVCRGVIQGGTGQIIIGILISSLLRDKQPEFLLKLNWIRKHILIGKQ